MTSKEEAISILQQYTSLISGEGIIDVGYIKKCAQTDVKNRIKELEAIPGKRSFERKISLLAVIVEIDEYFNITM